MKLNLNKYPYQIAWCLTSIVLLILSINRYYENKNLEVNGVREKFKIVEKNCRRSSTGGLRLIYFEDKKKEVNRIEATGYDECIAIGDSLELVYNFKLDYYFLPDSLWRYERYIIGCIFSLFFSVLPWTWIKKNLEK